MKGIIYKYTFPNGKVYIGQTRRHPEKRKREHLDALVGPTNSGFWNAYKTFGMPQYEELYAYESNDVDELVSVLNVMETRYIQLYKADRPEYGYNKKSFGTVGTGSNIILQRKFYELSGQTAKSRLQVYNSLIDKLWKTKEPLTEEEKFLAKEMYRKENIWQSHIERYDFDNLLSNSEEDTEFMVEEALPFVRYMIMQDAQENAVRYINENYSEILNEERDKNAVVQIDKNGNIVREFNSFNEICQAFNVPRADNVRNVLHGRQKSAYGFFWKYKKDM